MQRNWWSWQKHRDLHQGAPKIIFPNSRPPEPLSMCHYSFIPQATLFFLIEVWLICNIILVLGVHHSDSVTYIYITVCVTYVCTLYIYITSHVSYVLYITSHIIYVCYTYLHIYMCVYMCITSHIIYVYNLHVIYVCILYIYSISDSFCLIVC